MRNILLFIVFALAFTSCSGNRQDKNPAAAQNDSTKMLVRRYIDEVWNKRDFSKADKYWGADFKNVFALQYPHGPEGMKTQVAYFLAAFDTFHFNVQDIIVEGDKVAAWVEITGRHTGELFGIKPTNKQVKFREAFIYKVVDGKLDEVYPFVDWNSLFMQLGQYPDMKNMQ
jgi:predicted ester cyclase